MFPRPFVTKLSAVVGAVALVLSACSTSGSSPGDPQDGDLYRLAGVDVVVVAEVEEIIGSPEGNPYVVVVHAVPSAVMWSSGSRFTPAGEKSTTLPSEMGKLESFNVWATHRLEAGVEYAFFVTESTVVQKDLVPGDWTSKFEVEIEGDRLAEGTSDIANKQAERVVDRSRLSLLESLIALTEELVRGISDHWAADIESASSTAPDIASYGPLSAAAFGDSFPIEPGAGIPEFNSIPWDLRQLPTNEDERLAIDGTGEVDFDWEWWEIAVQYDDQTLEDYAWVGIQFPGVGVIGPVFLDPADRIVPVFGWGPAGDTPQIVFWPTFGELRTTPPESKADIVDRKAVGSKLAPKSNLVWDDDGALLVRLENSEIARVEPISAETLEELVSQLTAPPDGSSELNEQDR
jgi:hypothetical protein